MPPPPRIHNLPHNSSERTPARWLFFDTETFPEAIAGGEDHSLRLWAAELVQRGELPGARPRAHAWTGSTTAQLADAVENACRPGERLWVCAHNLGFDLAVTALPLELIARGWELTQHAIAGPSPWLRMRRGTRGLTMVDSWSWLPRPLEQLGAQVGVAKPPVDFATVDHATLLERCQADVAILRAAMIELIDWWEANHLGHWSLTGPATGFNAYRHSRMHAKVVINPDGELRALERGVIYGGRCEVWRTGRLDPGLYAYVDFEHTFGSICATAALPRKHARRFESLPLDHQVLDGRWIDLLATVLIQTNRPSYPLRTSRGVVHPVGSFTTTLCGPEIREARRRGELQAIGPGLMYCVAPHMADWARWTLEIVDSTDPQQSEVVRTAVKGWTRSVPGRWAGRTSRTVHEFAQPVPGWRLEHGHQGFSGEAISILDCGGTRYWIAQDVEMDNGFPGILAWIQSHVRVLLSRLIDLIGEDAMVLCNTDGVVIDLDRLWGRWEAGTGGAPTFQQAAELLDSCLTEWTPQTAPLTPRVKWYSRSLEVLSPQHLITDHSRNLSGVPRAAEHLGEHVYVYTDWPKLSTQLELDRGAGYRRTTRVVDLGEVPTLRWVFSDGTTAPVAAAGAIGEPCRLLGPDSLNGALQGRQLAARQHPLLEKLRRE
jgi:hypothetical protein